jgi:SPP1 gp7 family putative phage head morphogenesis protein
VPNKLIGSLLDADPALRRRVRKVVPPRILPPDPVERRYIKFLEGYVKGIEREVMPTIMQLVRAGVAEEQVRRARADVDWWPALLTYIEQAKGLFGEPKEQIERIAAAVSTFNQNQVLRFTRSVLGVNVLAQEPQLADTLATFAQENVELITRLKVSTFDRIKEQAQKGVVSGKPNAQIARELQDAFGIEARHARLIARDQVSKLNGQLTMTRQTALGITHYKWRTSGDERVRDTNRANNNQVFAWDSPPATGHPGEDYQCRCWAAPVLDDL